MDLNEPRFSARLGNLTLLSVLSSFLNETIDGEGAAARTRSKESPLSIAAI